LKAIVKEKKGADNIVYKDVDIPIISKRYLEDLRLFQLFVEILVRSNS